MKKLSNLEFKNEGNNIKNQSKHQRNSNQIEAKAEESQILASQPKDFDPKKKNTITDQNATNKPDHKPRRKVRTVVPDAKTD